jgi:DNA-binding response OmpR family regulator
MAIRALLIDDDTRLHELLSSYLPAFDIHLTHAVDGGRGLAALEKETFDLVLLDVMMPGLSGLDVLTRVRAKSHIPVVMLTARGDEADRVVGLELGADDYLAKPFSPRELVARIRAVLRRGHSEGATGEHRIGSVVVDIGAREVKVDGARVELTSFEFDLLTALMKRKGRVLSRDALLQEAGRGDVSVSERTVDVHISHLRTKIGDETREQKLIKTVRGVGYVMTDAGDP